MNTRGTEDATRLRSLYDRAMQRHRPEDVAEAILDQINDDLSERLPKNVVKALEIPARGSLKNRGWHYSSMAADFFEAVVHVRPQVMLAARLLDVPPVRAKHRDEVLSFVERCGELLGGLDEKLNKASRRAIGLYKGHRWYNKRRRLLLRIGQKLERQIHNDRRNELRRASKTVLLNKLTYADFAKDELTACFVAYYAARMGLRSTFTNTSQVRAFDTVCETLFSALRGRRETCWFAVAHVMADREVVRRLTEEERGRLLGAAYEQLLGAADVLENTWQGSDIDRKTMIVRRGFDSSTWNEAAGAWNRLRESWISLLYALGMQHMLDHHLPGKVMRVIAADVAAWHRASGGRVHPDTLVWSRLPFPWVVLRGDARCTRETIRREAAYAAADCDGWAGPKRKPRDAAKFTPTPELVHGVTVSSPGLASALRKAGVFSGKLLGQCTTPYVVARDAHGFALAAAKPVETSS